MNQGELFEFMRGPRGYEAARSGYRFECPGDFNFAYDVIDRLAESADKTALVIAPETGAYVRRLNYSELARRSAAAAHGLRALGVGVGEFVCVISGRCAEWYDAVFGCMRIGAVTLPGTPLLTARDIAYRIQQTGARTVIVSPEHCEKIDAIRADCPSLERCVTLGPPRGDGWDSLEAVAAPYADAPPPPRPDLRKTDVMMAYFTSGTTGPPKLVPRDFSYALAHASTGLFWMDLRRDDVHWTLTDTGWAKAAWGLLFAPFLCQSAVVIDEAQRFDPARCLALISRLGVTTFCAPPTVYRLFAQTPGGDADLTSLRRCLGSGEALNPEAIRAWRERTGLEIADGYGQTEMAAVIGVPADKPGRPGSMGLALPGFDVRVLTPDGAEAEAGAVGEVAVREGAPGLFGGYRTAAGLDRRPFADGWYRTGDTAWRDADGYFWFVGRGDDLILSAGYRISPFEVENALLAHPAVVESAVVGESDAERGQVVVAHVVLAAGRQPSAALAEELQEFCKAETAPYKYPRRIYFTTLLPKTISGKIRRRALREGGAP